MSIIQRLAIVDPQGSACEELKGMLTGLDRVWLEADCASYRDFVELVQRSSLDLAVVCLDDDPQQAFAMIEELRRGSAPSILAISSSNDGQLILQAMRTGVTEFLTRPYSLEELLAVLDKIYRQRYGGSEDDSHSGCVTIAVAGATGGVGSTSLAVNLACALASNPVHSVVLLDLDLALGDADIFLDTIPDHTLVDVAQNVERLDFDLLRRSLARHSSGVYLLPRPIDLSEAGMISPEDFRRVLGLFEAAFSHVVLDLSKSYNALDMTALEACDHLLLTAQLDLPCLRNVVRLLQSFKSIEGLDDKVKVAFNRVSKEEGQIRQKKAQELIGREVFALLPNDYRMMVEACNNGTPMVLHAPKAPLSQAFTRVAQKLEGGEQDTEPPPAPAGNRWFSFFSSAAAAQ